MNAQAKHDAASELIRAEDALRELNDANRPATQQDRERVASAHNALTRAQNS